MTKNKLNFPYNGGPSNTQIGVQSMRKSGFRVKRLQDQIWVCHTIIKGDCE